MEKKDLHNVEITILKKLKVEEIHAEYSIEKNPVICRKGEVGDVFLSVNAMIPDDLCKGAWSGLEAKVLHLASGGSSPYTKEDGIAVHSCNDGLHPVVFKLERLAR